MPWIKFNDIKHPLRANARVLLKNGLEVIITKAGFKSKKHRNGVSHKRLLWGVVAELDSFSVSFFPKEVTHIFKYRLTNPGPEFTPLQWQEQ